MNLQNHLDIDSKEMLEQALQNFEGTIIFVSHDRYFINQLANKVFDLNHDGGKIYLGNYQYYIEKPKNKQLSKHMKTYNVLTINGENHVNNDNHSNYFNQKEHKRQQRKIERQIEQCETRIETFETQITDIDEQLTQPEVLIIHKISRTKAKLNLIPNKS